MTVNWDELAATFAFNAEVAEMALDEAMLPVTPSVPLTVRLPVTVMFDDTVGAPASVTALTDEPIMVAPVPPLRRVMVGLASPLFRPEDDRMTPVPVAPVVI